MMLWIWLVITILTAIVELITTDLVSIWFTLGGFAAMIACLCQASELIQIIIFIAVSLICMISIRPLTKKYLRTNIVSTNYDRVIGQHGLVLEKIDADNRIRAVLKQISLDFGFRRSNFFYFRVETFFFQNGVFQNNLRIKYEPAVIKFPSAINQKGNQQQPPQPGVRPGFMIIPARHLTVPPPAAAG